MTGIFFKVRIHSVIFFAALQFGAFSADASLPPVSPFYDIPYNMNDAYTGWYYSNSLFVIAEKWWPDYQQYWGVQPYGPRVCSYTLNTFPNGPQNNNFGSVTLTGQCSGGNVIHGQKVCPGGYTLNGAGTLCTINGEADKEKNYGSPPNCDGVGNPVHTGTGNKYQEESDVGGQIPVNRYYNSQSKRDQGTGFGWSFSYSRKVTVLGNSIRVTRDDGYTEYFNCSSSPCQGGSDTLFRVTKDANGYSITDAAYTVEQYAPNGLLQLITYVSGITDTPGYDAQNRLDRVDQSTGEYIRFTYDSTGRLETLLTNDETRAWGYRYDAIGNLEYVDNPDGTFRQYHYEDTNSPRWLTGITDERGNRYATFEYNANGEATASYHGPQTSTLTDRIDGVSITYNGDGSRTVTNSNGNSSTYTATTQVGISLTTDITGPGCSSCGTGNTSYSYDPANNNLLSKTENTITTEFDNYDANGNPGFMIEAKGTTEERRTDYTYDPRFNNKITTITAPSVFGP